MSFQFKIINQNGEEITPENKPAWRRFMIAYGDFGDTIDKIINYCNNYRTSNKTPECINPSGIFNISDINIPQLKDVKKLKVIKEHEDYSIYQLDDKNISVEIYEPGASYPKEKGKYNLHSTQKATLDNGDHITLLNDDFKSSINTALNNGFGKTVKDPNSIFVQCDIVDSSNNNFNLSANIDFESRAIIFKDRLSIPHSLNLVITRQLSSSSIKEKFIIPIQRVFVFMLNDEFFLVARNPFSEQISNVVKQTLISQRIDRTLNTNEIQNLINQAFIPSSGYAPRADPSLLQNVDIIRILYDFKFNNKKFFNTNIDIVRPGDSISENLLNDLYKITHIKNIVDNYKPVSPSFRKRLKIKTSSIPTLPDYSSMPGGMPTIGMPGGMPTIGMPGGMPTIGMPGGMPQIGMPGGMPQIGMPGGMPTIGMPGGMPGMTPEQLVVGGQGPQLMLMDAPRTGLEMVPYNPIGGQQMIQPYGGDLMLPGAAPGYTILGPGESFTKELFGEIKMPDKIKDPTTGVEKLPNAADLMLYTTLNRRAEERYKTFEEIWNLLKSNFTQIPAVAEELFKKAYHDKIIIREENGATHSLSHVYYSEFLSLNTYIKKSGDKGGDEGKADQKTRYTIFPDDKLLIGLICVLDFGNEIIIKYPGSSIFRREQVIEFPDADIEDPEYYNVVGPKLKVIQEIIKTRIMPFLLQLRQTDKGNIIKDKIEAIRRIRRKLHANYVMRRIKYLEVYNPNSELSQSQKQVIESDPPMNIDFPYRSLRFKFENEIRKINMVWTPEGLNKTPEGKYIYERDEFGDDPEDMDLFVRQPDFNSSAFSGNRVIIKENTSYTPDFDRKLRVYCNVVEKLPEIHTKDLYTSGIYEFNYVSRLFIEHDKEYITKMCQNPEITGKAGGGDNKKLSPDEINKKKEELRALGKSEKEINEEINKLKKASGKGNQQNKPQNKQQGQRPSSKKGGRGRGK